MTATFTQHRTVKAHVDRWRDRVSRRIHAHDPGRPVWDRKRFLVELWEDCPDCPPREAVELAHAFEAAIAEGRGNRKRFRDALERRGVTATT